MATQMDDLGRREPGSKIRWSDPNTLAPVASLLATNEDWMVFRRFDECNLLNLLILQGELQKLTEQLQELCSKAGAEPSAVETAWYAAPPSSAARGGMRAATDAERQQWLKEREDLWVKLRDKLREYRMDGFLLDVSRLRTLEPPDSVQVQNLRQELAKLVEQKRVIGKSMESWDSAYDDDLVVLRNGADKPSKLTNWIKLGIGVLRWELWTRKQTLTTPRKLEEPRVIVVGKKQPHVSKAEMAKKHAFISRSIMSLFGGLALIVPTIIMAKVGDLNANLIVTSVAVILFGLILALGATDSTGKDVLAATAAYTAVLVVFVGTSLQSTGG